MKYQSLFAVGALLIGCTEAAPTALPVCIVGAGPSGLIVASKLEAKGQSVIIFEKQNSVGGKSQSYYDTDGSYHPDGAVLFSNATYVEGLKIINAMGVPAIVFNSGVEYDFNVATGAAAQPPSPGAEFSTLLVAEYTKYVTYWNTVFAPYAVPRYKNGVPAEFAVTTAEWLSSNGYQALPVVFVRAMSAFGYGDIRDTPILYILTYLNPDNLGYFLKLHSWYAIDFHEVFLRFSKTLKGPIHLGNTISKIDRSGANPVITSNLGDQQCASIVLAFPPSLASLQNAKLDLSADETAIFTPVDTTPYWVAQVDMYNTPFGVAYTIALDDPTVPPPNDGEPVTLLSLFSTSHIFTSWSWGNSQTNFADAYAQVKTVLSRLNRDPGNDSSVAQPITDAQVKRFTAPTYFPRFSAADLKADIYTKYNALQGKQKTYYVSALDGFELVEFALRAGVDLVATYF